MPLRCTRLCGNISPLVQSLLDLPMKWCQAHSYWLRCMSCLQISILSNEGVHWWMESMLFLSLTNTTSCQKQRVSWMQAIPSDWTDSSTPALSTSAVHDDFNHLVISTLSRHCFPLFCCSLCFHITVLLWRKNPPTIFTCIFREVFFFFCSIRFGYPVGLGIWFHFSVILSSPCGITHSIATGILPLK